MRKRKLNKTQMKLFCDFMDGFEDGALGNHNQYEECRHGYNLGKAARLAAVVQARQLSANAGKP